MNFNVAQQSLHYTKSCSQSHLELVYGCVGIESGVRFEAFLENSQELLLESHDLVDVAIEHLEVVAAEKLFPFDRLQVSRHQEMQVLHILLLRLDQLGQNLIGEQD